MCLTLCVLLIICIQGSPFLTESGLLLMAGIHVIFASITCQHIELSWMMNVGESVENVLLCLL